MGPTASGKTRLACRLAAALNGEVISADSRQVYKGLNIGTGKDLEEYNVNGKRIPFHLIDVVDPGEQFYLHQFAEALKYVFEDVSGRRRLPVICGGTGLYLDAIRKDFSFTQVKENPALRKTLEGLPREALLAKLSEFPKDLTEHVDKESKKRLIRGIEIAQYRSENNLEEKESLPYRPLWVGISTDIETRKKRISQRLGKRLSDGLIEEVQALLKSGLSHERLEALGLEYKFVSYYLRQKISREELFLQLQTAIFQFAKRQMTWFRKMEREGVEIHWVEADSGVDEIIEQINNQPRSIA